MKKKTLIILNADFLYGNFFLISAAENVLPVPGPTLQKDQTQMANN